MTYSSVMVHLDLDRSNEALLKVAGDVAERFGARIIGIAASEPMTGDYGDSTRAGGMIEQDSATVKRMAVDVEQEFRAAMMGKASDVQWRTLTTYEPPANIIAANARAADLLIIAPAARNARFGSARRVDLSDLVMQIGRPVMLVPPTATKLDLQRVIVGWTDSKTTRHAVHDALPLLRQAGQVCVIELTNESGLREARLRVEDVVDWMKGHGIAAEAQVHSVANSDGRKLEDLAAERHAGMLVTGAYSHTRLRELLLGGVTRNLLAEPSQCRLLSH